MAANTSLAEQLDKVNQWVLDEFSYLDELLQELGCAAHPEGGPGVAYKAAGRTVARVHPKRRRVRLGLPEGLRPDVDALNTQPSVQRGSAWLNYEPDVCDRDVVEGLITRAWQESDLAAAVKASRSGVKRRAQPKRDDNADLALVLAVLRAYKDHEGTTGRPQGGKVLRELLYFVWEHPRLPPGRKKSRHLPHSPKAAQQRLAGNNKGLVYEHVQPISTVTRRLLLEIPADEVALRQVLEATADRVLITQAENRALTAARVGHSSPDPDDPWSRYKTIGLTKADFVPLLPPPGASGP